MVLSLFSSERLGRMESLSRDQILKAADLKVEKVDVPEWGGAIYLKVMSVGERDSYENEWVKSKLTGMDNFRTRFLVRTICDVQGNRLFENKDIEKNTWYYSPKETATSDDQMRQDTLRALNLVDVFIITIGLSEVWYNKINKQVFWKAIPASEYDETKHGFRVSSVEENTMNLENIYSIIKKHLPINELFIMITL